MELDNNIAKQTYIQLLADILMKKRDVLNQLLNLTETQEAIISSEDFQEEEFLNIISLKEEKIQALTKLDIGFEQIYENVKSELSSKGEKYAVEIAKLKEYIVAITDLSVKLQTLELRNKSKMEVVLATKRKNIKIARMSNQTAANYYKSMAQHTEEQSYFYDKKK